MSSGSKRDLQPLIASLLVVRASGFLGDHQRRYPRWELANAELKHLLQLGVGGVILLGGSAAEVAVRCRQLRQWASQPLLLCADVEEGVGQRFDGASWLVPPLALGRLHRRDPQRALVLAERYGHCCGSDARRLGINWLLAPVCDVNNNPANPVINVRAFAEEPLAAGLLVSAFIRGARRAGVLTCAKHFPGHGDTCSDSHIELPVLPHSLERLQAVELPPFEAAIAAGVSSIMTAHLLLPGLDEQRPATLSPVVLRQLLRQQLGFQGLVVTDALVMEAIAGRYGPGEAAVLALEAGADLLLMPGDAMEAIAAISEAIQQQRLPIAQLLASAERRKHALASLRKSGASATPETAAQPDEAFSHELIDATLETTLKHADKPAESGPQNNDQIINLICLESILSAPFLDSESPAVSLPKALGWQTIICEQHSPGFWEQSAHNIVELSRMQNKQVLVQLFQRGNPFRGTNDLDKKWAGLIMQLHEAESLWAIIVYGSPYLWEHLREAFSDQKTAIIVYSPGQMPMAQSAALNRIDPNLRPKSSTFTN